jgi:hypothetical protein
MRRKMAAMKLSGLVTVGLNGLMVLAAGAAPAPSPWEHPAAALAEQIAGILGPGEARLTVRNLSSIPTDEIPAIRLLLQQDLKAHGVTISGADSANSVRITLSESARERLWVAEVAEGAETKVAMVKVDFEAASVQPAQDRIVLRKELYLGKAQLSMPPIFSDDQPILAMIKTAAGLVVLRQDDVLIFAMTQVGWKEEKTLDLGSRLPLTRDPRGILLPTDDGNGFTAFVAGTECNGSYTPGTDNSGKAGDWSVKCREGDDPWPLRANVANPAGSAPASSAALLKAFYNAARNYFTGLVVPVQGADLPPFYSAALLARPVGTGLLIGGIDGKVQMVENGALKPVAGARDWGSDFAALHSGCGGGTQILASGSGEAANDSLRAYELPALEAVPASAPLAMEGAVTAMWSAPDGKSVFAVVRNPANEYEVDRVTALCN